MKKLNLEIALFWWLCFSLSIAIMLIVYNNQTSDLNYTEKYQNEVLTSCLNEEQMKEYNNSDKNVKIKIFQECENKLNQ